MRQRVVAYVAGFKKNKSVSSPTPHITTTKNPITPADIRNQLMKTGLPPGIELVTPDEAKTRMRENGHDLSECYNPDEVIEVRVNNEYDLCAVTLFLEKVFAIHEQSLPANARHVEIFSEAHLMSAHVMARACRISSKPGTIFCHEKSANHLATYAHSAYDLPLSRLSLDGLHKADPNGHLYARTMITNNGLLVPQATNHLFQAIINTNGTTSCIDAMKKGQSLDKDDPLVQTLVKDLFPTVNLADANFPIHPLTQEKDVRGVIIRNHIMAFRALETRGDMISTGLFHLGNKIDLVTYKDSLPSLYLGQSKKTPSEYRSYQRIFFIFKASMFTRKHHPTRTSCRTYSGHYSRPV